MKYFYLILAFLFTTLAIAGGVDVQQIAQAPAPALPDLEEIPGWSLAITDAIDYVKAHPIAGAFLSLWGAHSEGAPFMKKWKHSGTIELGVQVVVAMIKAGLGVLRKPKE
jgi:hypothetical protein